MHLLQGGLSRRGFLIAGTALLLPVATEAAEASKRIVSAGSDVTETVVLLAGIEALRGVDITSRTPEAVRKLPSIGYLRQISAEGVLSLSPDLLIANGDLGPPNVIEQLRAAGLKVEVIKVDPEYTAEGMAEKIVRVGAILGAESQAAGIAARVRADMAALAGRLDGVGDRPRVAFLRAIDGGRPIVAGKISSIDAAFGLAGGRNAYTDFTLFKPLSREAIVAAPPDFVVIAADAVAKAGGPDAVIAGLGLTEAWKERPDRLVAVEATSLFSFGPSGATEIARLAAVLHPERFAASP